MDNRNWMGLNCYYFNTIVRIYLEYIQYLGIVGALSRSALPNSMDRRSSTSMKITRMYHKPLKNKGIQLY